MNRPRNLILIGPMGAGKTCVGRRLAELHGLTLADVDKAVEQRAGTSVADIFQREGEAGFRAREQAALSEALRGEETVVATGGGAVLDPANRERMRSRGLVVYLQVSVAEQLRRLERDTSRPLLAAADRANVLHELAAVRGPLYRDLAELTLETDGCDVDQVAARLALALDGRWPGAGAAA